MPIFFNSSVFFLNFLKNQENTHVILYGNNHYKVYIYGITVVIYDLTYCPGKCAQGIRFNKT